MSYIHQRLLEKLKMPGVSRLCSGVSKLHVVEVELLSCSSLSVLPTNHSTGLYHSSVVWLKSFWDILTVKHLRFFFQNSLFLSSNCLSNITWWRWSTAHGLEVLGSGLTKVCWGSQRVPSRRSTGILRWWVTVGTDFGPWQFCWFPRCFMKSSFLMTDCYTYRWNKYI